MIERKDGFTFSDIADALGITKKTATRRIYTLEAIHGPVRAFRSRIGMSHLTTYTLTERGFEVAQTIALRLPIPGTDCYQQPKLSAVESNYLAMRRTLSLPTFVDHTVTGFR
jgi:predicted DNA-binding transcriptional regulator YafY